MNLDSEWGLLGIFLETFPKGEILANEEICGYYPQFLWNYFRELLPHAIREEYRLARNALIDEKDAAKKAAREKAVRSKSGEGRADVSGTHPRTRTPTRTHTHTQAGGGTRKTS